MNRFIKPKTVGASGVSPLLPDASVEANNSDRAMM